MNERPRPTLRRTLTLPLVVLYGVGTIIGAGIYALIGEVAAVAGYGAPLSFLLAAVVAAFTAASFAELAARFPRAAGAALYVQQGFGRARLAVAVGLMVATSGVVSAAALTNGFVGYLQSFVSIDRSLAILVVVVSLGALAAWGIAQSVAVAALITVVELGGLLVVIVAGADALATLPQRWHEFMPGVDAGAWGGALLGVTLSFYAFIGFEDMVDIAEEVRDVRRTLPRAILATLLVTSLVYLLLVCCALLVLDPATLAASDAPVAAVFAAATGLDPAPIGIVAMFAIVNGALIQMVMASRVLYGLASRGQAPALLSRVNARTRTPVVATAVITLVIGVLAWTGRLSGLAVATSMIMLTIFTLVNLALWRIKSRESDAPGLPRAVPMTGALLSAALIAWELAHRAGVV